MSASRAAWLAPALLALALGGSDVRGVSAARVPDIANTKHNLSITGPGPVKAVSETQICAFCHTPHHAETQPAAPLWNRRLSGATYTPYGSSSIEASALEMAAAPGGTSKLCLSCHDGTLALGSVDVLNAQPNAAIAMQNTGPGGTMPPGPGATTGFTRNLGVNLTNDHPISFTYDASLAASDGELRAPDGALVGTRLPGVAPKPRLPLENGQLQCATCHDPHLRETDPLKLPAKFLRANRLQEAPPSGGAFSDTADMICLACHDKAGQAWAFSAHAHPQVADELYTPAAAAQRDFPANLPVWKAGCLNCHDAHTAQGARRLLREGTDSLASPKAGGNPAQEQTCYQCHSALGQSALASVAGVPNIRDEFALTYRMPITDTDQQRGAPEVHDIGTGPGTRRGKDFVEAPLTLGKGDATNRHAECSDCHNPHRVTRKRAFNADASTPDTAGTHGHAAGHTNLASGVLRGITGVEPVYASASFGANPASYDFKRGDGGAGAGTGAASAWVTREYQVCLKCHSNHAYDVPPDLSTSGGGTPSGTNGLARYTNQAMEFQAPLGHKGEATTFDGGAASAFSANNHRGWHPVIDNTARSHAVRGTTAASFLAPWNGAADVGTQTMYCSDCHGGTSAGDTVSPPAGKPWGPHGSTNPFILKGEWGQLTGTGARDGGFTANALCFKCHSAATYADRNGGGGTAFSGGGQSNLHAFHVDKIGRLRCTWCHVAVPHGWKNKSLLVNLNDVGPEAVCRAEDAADLPTALKCTVGQPMAAGTQMRNGPAGSGATSTTDWRNRGYTNPPYYLNAMLKIVTFRTSGGWTDTSCGSYGPSGQPGNGQTGRAWMRDSNETCASPP
jgi:predicted CXXCH cytochrome family protein